MSIIKKQDIIGLIGIFLLLSATIGGYFILGQREFFFFSLMGMTGGVIMLYFYLKSRQRMNKQKIAKSQT